MSAQVASAGPPVAEPVESADEAVASLDVVFRNLRSSATGLTSREATRRLVSDGLNQLVRRGKRRWPADLLKQLTQPLALLLEAAAILAVVNGAPLLAAAIAAVIALNAVLALLQEQHAEHSVEALAAYLPTTATVVRDGSVQDVEATTLVPGDLLILHEGDRISADARLIDGPVEVDVSTLTGESQPVVRIAGHSDAGVPLLEAENMLFSGSAVIAGDARAVVTATGMRSEIGRIAAMSERVGDDSSPLEVQVTRVARLIAVVSVIVAVAFLPLGAAAGLSAAATVSFAIGMLVANVPEGLLPTITLALAAGVQTLAHKGAVVKRLSAVETLGSTTVICTDKTGTLTQNRMRVTDVWTHAGAGVSDPDGQLSWPPDAERGAAPLARLVISAARRASTAELTATGASGDPSEIAVVRLSVALHVPSAPPLSRKVMFRFDPRLRLMSTVDLDGGRLWVNVKGAPEAVLALATHVATGVEHSRPITADDRTCLAEVIAQYGQRGLRLLAVARRPLPAGAMAPVRRDLAEKDLCLLGIIAMLDPPRPEVREAIDRAHRAGIRILVITGDNGTTATEIARQVGIGTGLGGSRIVTGDELDVMSEAQLDEILTSSPEIVFARSSPEAKLRIADALRGLGEVVAMTGDGVNDAPALRAANIGVAMGRSGTEVARQAATMVLTDDNFATIIDAVEEGRRIYDNVQKFILYIFTHAVPEIAPFVIFALSGGAIPLPLTVLQLLAIDLLTDTLPALALSREPAESGLMEHPPRPTSEGIIGASLLARSWGFLGLISAALVLSGFFIVLCGGGWHLHASTGTGTPLHHVYLQASTIAWLGIVACQMGAALAARTDRVSLRAAGWFTNPLLLAGIMVELVLAAGVIYLPILQPVFGTAAPNGDQLLLVLPFPFIVWGADETRRWIHRRRHPRAAHGG